MEEQQNNENAGWSFKNEQPQATAAPPSSQPQVQQAPITWTASEFVANHKSPMWYVGLFTGTILLSALLYFVFHDVIAVVFIVIVSILFATLGGKKPRQLPYQVDDRGITINGKFYSYNMFKSFSVLREGAMSYVNLLPLQRFMPEISIYFAAEDEDKIVEALTNNLPYEHRNESSFDRLMKKLHF